MVGVLFGAVAITLKAIALLDLSSVLLFVSPKASYELNAVNRTVG
jgi:hypothetical protein